MQKGRRRTPWQDEQEYAGSKGGRLRPRTMLVLPPSGSHGGSGEIVYAKAIYFVVGRPFGGSVRTEKTACQQSMLESDGHGRTRKCKPGMAS